jgi:hypothetical protein
MRKAAVIGFAPILLIIGMGSFLANWEPPVDTPHPKTQMELCQIAMLTLKFQLPDWQRAMHAIGQEDALDADTIGGRIRYCEQSIARGVIYSPLH